MPLPFVKNPLVGRKALDLPSRECVGQHFGCIEMRGVARPAGSEGDLFGSISMHDKPPARPGCLRKIRELALAKGRIGKLHKDCRHQIKLTRPVPVVPASNMGLNLDTTARGKGAASFNGGRRRIERRNGKAPPRQIDGIPPLAISNAKRRLATFGEPGVVGQNNRWFGAKYKAIAGAIALFPHQAVGIRRSTTSAHQLQPAGMASSLKLYSGWWTIAVSPLPIRI